MKAFLSVFLGIGLINHHQYSAIIWRMGNKQTDNRQANSQAIKELVSKLSLPQSYSGLLSSMRSAMNDK